jgi:crotonobetainyl-CoA:carnitine CoA-transferase CaiB-like acyl-CoA transferase
MEGVTIVEVAQFTFTPSAGAVLADWGADVIKVEHAVNGDAQRGLRLGTGGVAEGSFQPLMEHPNRGKRSIGLALETEGGREVLYKLVEKADVFVVNFLPAARRKLKIDVESIRAVNPEIIYVRGSAHGQRGPDAEKGGYDSATYWSRSGSAMGVTPPDSPRVMGMPAGAYGDSIGGMTIAGGIAGALFARERTGEPSIVDVSLMSVGIWAMALGVGNAMLLGEDVPVAPLDAPPHLAVNPTVGNFRTADGRWINLTMLQPGRYWADLVQHLDRPELAADERFDSGEKLMALADEAGRIVAEAIGSKPFAHWLERFQTLQGQWSVNQTPLETASDPQTEPNGYVLPVIDAGGNVRRLVANPVQFDETPPTITRAPQFAEHTDELLRALHYDEEAIINLKIGGGVT